MGSHFSVNRGILGSFQEDRRNQLPYGFEFFMGARVVDRISVQGSRMADAVLNRNSRGHSVEYDCMKTGIVKLVLLFCMRLCVWLSQLCCHDLRSIN